ncbi:GNAT family N-acetyltransferase [Roseateles sp.]|uniref:GNAT family N-acetyltransferase n=1 Tax=Roseateles sp. TaxID=1971397 RepID=UPI00394E143B
MNADSIVQPGDPILLNVPRELVGERLLLTAPQMGLGAEMAVAISQSLDHLKPWMPWAQDAPTAESSEAVVRRMHADFVTRRDLCFHVFLLAAEGRRGRLVGGTGLHRVDWTVRRFEIGYWLRPDVQGQGLASECVRLLSRMAFDTLQARRVEIRCDTRNTRSRAVAERCGFELEGVLRRESLGVDGEPRDTAVYARIEA